MTRILRAAAFGLAASALSASTAIASPLEGVWKITRVVTTGPDASTTTSPQPSIVIFHGRYYSYVSAGNSARTGAPAAKDPSKLTDAEKLAKYEEWSPVTGQAGTFELKGGKLIRHPSVAKNVSVMTTDGPITQDYHIKGSDLVLVSKSAAGQAASETRTTLTRVR